MLGYGELRLKRFHSLHWLVLLLRDSQFLSRSLFGADMVIMDLSFQSNFRSFSLGMINSLWNKVAGDES